MKKTLLTLLALIFAFTSLLPAQNAEADQAYIKAVTTQDPVQKVRLMKDYVNKYGGQGTKYENFVYGNLCIIPSNEISSIERINYGEKAISLGNLEEMLFFQVYLTVSGLYSQSGQNLDKAKAHAQKAVQMAKSARSKATEPANKNQWGQLVAAAEFTGGQAMEKGGDPKGALKSYISAYNTLKNPQILASIKKIGKSLYDTKQFKDAEQAFALTSKIDKDYANIAYYARCLHRNGKKNEAVVQYKQAYNKQKSGDLAYNIGILLAGQVKSNPAVSNEAIQYLLDAAFLSKANTEKAMTLAQGLFFNSANKNLQYNEKVQELTARSKKLNDMTEAFNTKYGEKDEEDLSDAEKKEMETELANIDAEKKALDRLQTETSAALEKFNQAIEAAKKRLGIG
ncbi:hypothetical protein ACFLT9_12310 [Acidobacteriota bacterium]